MLTKEEWKNNLSNATYEVTFNKKNGEQRIMTCSLNPSIVPQTPSDSPKRVRTEPTTDAVSCYDINVNGWRSFNASNVTSFKKVE